VWEAVNHLFLLNPIPCHMRNYCQKSERLHHGGSNLADFIATLLEARKSKIEKTILRYVSELLEKDITSLKAELYGPFKIGHLRCIGFLDQILVNLGMIFRLQIGPGFGSWGLSFA
jgi:hypothetical protein